MTVLTASALTTLEDTKAYLRLTKSGDDEIIKRLINLVSADCEAFCSRSFLDVTYTDEIYNGNAKDTIFLRNYPLIAVTSITTQKNATPITDSGTAYDFNPTTGELVLLGGRIFAKSYREVKVTYQAGYATVSVLPLALRYSIEQGVAMKLQEQAKKSYHVTRQEIGGDVGGTVDYIETEYPKHVLKIWKRHKRKLAGYSENG